MIKKMVAFPLVVWSRLTTPCFINGVGGFLNSSNLLWVDLIKSCYGSDGGFCMASRSKPKKGVWMGIVNTVWDMHYRGLIPFDSICRRVGNGQSISFWNDVWCGDIMLRDRFPCLCVVASNVNALVSDYWDRHDWKFQWFGCLMMGFWLISFFN